MSSVDDRIVNMQFNNKQFVQGASDSKKALETLEQSMAKTGSSDGLGKMAASVDNVASRFGAMKIAGITAIATVAQKATEAGIRMVKGMTIDPILAGFREYETNLNSIQTIMANTGKKVNIVNKYLNDLNHYSDQTIYNFSQMADSIGKFTAAGVPLKEATSSIKGMANMAALSGSNVQQLNTAMYQMSQALSTGTIRLMDWNSLANAGMGGKNIREALMATNRTLGDHGTAMDAAIKKQGSFRDSLTEGWLTADTFNKTMKVMAGQTTKTGKTVAYTVEQLKGMGYSEKAAEQMHKLSKASIESATKIKTMSQLLDVVKESIGSGWAKLFQDLFGNFDEATKLWTGVGNSITGVVGHIFASVDQMLVGWRELGGYQDLWTGFGNIFKTIGNLISPFVTAFKSLLPSTASAGAGLAKATSGFASITGVIEKASRGAAALTPILTSLFGVIGKVASIGAAAFRGLAPLIPLLQRLASAVGDMFNQGIAIGSGIIDGLLVGLDPAQIQDAVVNFALGIVDWIKGALGIHSPAQALIPVGVNIVQGIAVGLMDGMRYLGENMGKIVSTIFEYIGGLFKGFDAMDWTALFNGILTGSLILTIRKITQFADTFKGWKNNIQDMFDQLGNTLQAFQSSLKAKALMDIAIAVGILAASVIALSFVDPKKLAIGLGAVTVMMGVLSGTLLALSKIQSDKQMAVLAASLLLISAAMIQFAGAVILLGTQPWQKLATGIGAMAAILGVLIGTMLAFSKIKGSIEGMAGSIFVLAVSMNILAGAVLAFGSMNMETLSKGIGAMAFAIGILVAALYVLGNKVTGSIEGAAASILIMSAAMVVLAAAILAFGKMKLGTLVQGMIAFGVAMAIMVVALQALSGNAVGVVAAAGAMLIMSVAMLALAKAVGIFGSMSVGTLAKGLIALGLAFVILLAAAAGAQVLAVGLEVLGSSILMIGAGMALAGVGMSMFAAGLALLATVGTAATAVIIAAIHAFLALLPAIAQQAAAAFVAFIKVIANASGEIRTAFAEIFKNMIGVVIDNIPVIAKLFTKLIQTGLKVIRKLIPDFVETGLTLIEKFLGSIAKHVPDIAKNGTDIVIAFVNAVADNYPRLVDAAFKAIIKFINGLADAIDDNVSDLRDAGLNLAHSLVNGLTGGLLDYGVQKIQEAINWLMDKIPGWAKKMLDINSPSKRMIPIGQGVAEGVVVGIQKTHKSVMESVFEMADKIIAAGNEAVLKAAREATKAQKKAYDMQAKADIAAEKARDAAALARKNKKDKAAQKRAKEAQKAADKAQTQADVAQKAADKANSKVDTVRTWENASLNERGNIKDQQAVALADRSQKMLAQAQAEAAEAKKLMKTNQEAGRKMLKRAREDAKKAKELEDKARKAHAEAQKYYAQEVNDRIKALEDASAADAKAAAEQARYDAADAQGKSDILKERAAADKAAADAARTKAAELVEQAKALAATDAAAAMKLLDEADQQSQAAKDLSEKAKQELEQAAQVLNESATAANSASTTPSRSILEDAASAVDRYTASLQEATALAAATQGPIQFTQNNYSPEALSAPEIYRQNKNLLSAAEAKMAALVG